MEKTGYLQLMKSRIYLPFLVSQILSNLSDGLLAVAVVYFAVVLEASPWELGVITFAITLSRGFLGPIGGVLSDRINKRTYLIAIEVIRAAFMLSLFVLYWYEMTNIWVLMSFGVIVSTLFAISVPAAKAVIPKLVTEDELQLANGLIQTITWPAYFMGSGLLALLLPLELVNYVFLVITVFFVVSFLLLLALPKQLQDTAPSNKESKPSLLVELLAGYQEMRSDSVMHARVLTYGIFTFFWRGVLQILIPLVVLTHLKSPEWVYGALMFVNGMSEFIANLVVGKLTLRRPLVFTFLCEGLLGIGVLLIASSFWLPLPEVGLLAGAFVVGVAAATIDIPLLTVIQKNVAEHNVAKVISYWFTIGSAGGALGSLIFGLYFEFIPIESGSLMLGIGLLLIGLVLLFWASKSKQYVALTEH
ncbi:hypothetical protein VHA01S_031_00040 [Vibrio halioticoli NBRC 102217]|uniref:Major facilitator superfamily (MFS) profile domain-containing protein n=1 Tax=Vibrio halioticoli NBRC 102217 TaxID=1219072 RepID=V5FJR5_9VIBR|nr:MFS transporter [Vibrio halioticoli]GAD89991.1 hypothetical protein VHA01S_031_00040 [Vibrio halioticoli NBRC 102217]